MTHDAVAAAVWSIVNLVLGAAAWRWSAGAGPDDSLASRALHALVIWWAVIVVAATPIGAAGLLSSTSLLSAVAVLGVILWRLGTSRLRQGTGAPERAGLILPALLLAWWGGHIAIEGLLRFPTDWDSLNYHMTLIDQWLQARSLYAPNDSEWYSPGNNEMVGLWLVAPYSGDFLISLTNLPAGAMLVLATLELARQLGLGRAVATFATLGTVANLVFFRQIIEAQNDVAVAGLFLAALAYACRYARSGRPAELIFAGIVRGLLAGIKYYALGYGSVAGCTLLLATWLTRPRHMGRALVAGLLGAFLLGGYWYVRNAWLTGTPLYPKGYDQRTDVMAGWRTGIWSSTLLGSGQPETLPLLLSALWRIGGPCQIAALLSAPMALAWLVTGHMVQRGADRATIAIRIALGAALLGSAVVWGITPFAVETTPGTLNMLKWGFSPFRFGLGFLSLGILALAAALDDLGAAMRRAADGIVGRTWLAGSLRVLAFVPMLLLAGSATYQFGRHELARKWDADLGNRLLVTANIIIVGANVVLCRLCWPGGRRLQAALAALAVVACTTFCAERLATRWHAGFTPFYDRYFHTEVFGRLAKRDPSTTTICTLSYRIYPFFGSHRQFQVARPLFVPDFPVLQKYLLSHSANVVVAIESDPFPNGRYRETKDWLAERRTLFRRFAGKTNYVVAYDVQLERLRELDNDTESSLVGDR
jgi:hypothetical protein